jgi:hypothetical protein
VAINSETYQKWQGYGALFSILPSIGSFYSNAPISVSIGLSCVPVVLGGRWLYRYIKTNGLPTILRALSYTRETDIYSYFENIQTDVKIDLDESGNGGKYEQVRLIECKVEGANEYYTRFVPPDKLINIRYDLSTIKTSVINADGRDVIVTLNEPCSLNERTHLKLTCDIVNMFVDNENYWLMHKFYEGEDATLTEIYFPKDHPPQSRNAEIITNEKYLKTRRLRNKPTLIYKDDRPVLVVRTAKNELKLHEKLKISWVWETHP